jgi:3'(2'), 5'-bisphosphate nucleotidase
MMLEKIDIHMIVDIAKDAGRAIMEIYKSDFEVEYKSDSSPLTMADKEAHTIIEKALLTLAPEIPLLSEEGEHADFELRKSWEYFWCIDPIDGTKEFVKRNGEFTVNIALIHHNTPVLGVVYAPVLDEVYYAKKGEGAFKNGIKLPRIINRAPEDKLTIVASKSHLSQENQDFIDNIAKTTKEIDQISKGSSLKLVMVAEGIADIYPRLAPTSEWDTAAAHAVVLESGKGVYQYQENYFETSHLPVVYNKENLLNPWFVVE